MYCSPNQHSKQSLQFRNSVRDVRTPGVVTQQADFALAAHPLGNEKLSILLIDDDSGIRLFLNRGLTRYGHCLFEASDGVIGLEQFYTLQPDVILLDITMPRLDGFAVLKEIRRCDAAVGIIMASALSLKQCVVEAMSGGADGYLNKPLRLQPVLAEVQRVSSLVRLRRYSREHPWESEPGEAYKAIVQK